MAGFRDLASVVAELVFYPRWDETSRLTITLMSRGAPGAVVYLVAGAVLLFRVTKRLPAEVH